MKMREPWTSLRDEASVAARASSFFFSSCVTSSSSSAPSSALMAQPSRSIFTPKKTKSNEDTYTVYLSTFLFVFFGLKMLREGYAMGADEGAEELEEVTQELKKKEEALAANESSRRLVQGSRIFMQVRPARVSRDAGGGPYGV